MSRITDGPIIAGDALDAASLNTRFASYTQTDLNAFNHRDAAHDRPQFAESGWLLTHAQSQDIGLNNWKHSSSVTVNGMTVMPADPHPIEDGAGNVSEMSFGAGLSVGAGEVLRAYWNLSAKATQGSNWNAATGSLGYYELPDGSGGHRKTDTWGGCWVFYLQWDITSAARTNYVAVPLQSDFKTAVGAYYGAPLSSTLASSVMPSGLRYATDPDAGTVPNVSTESTQRWRGISGAWYYPRDAGAQVIYGLRVVVKGVMHPYQLAGVNYLVHDTVYSDGASLDYNGGNLAVLKHRVK